MEQDEKQSTTQASNDTVEREAETCGSEEVEQEGGGCADKESASPEEGNDSPSGLTDTEDILSRECDGGSAGIGDAPSEEEIRLFCLHWCKEHIPPGKKDCNPSDDGGADIFLDVLRQGDGHVSPPHTHSSSKGWKFLWLLIALVGMSVMTLALFAVIVPINESGSLLAIGLSSSNSAVPDWYLPCIIGFITIAAAFVSAIAFFKQKKLLFNKCVAIVFAVVGLLLAMIYCLTGLSTILQRYPFIIGLGIIFLLFMGAALRLLYLCFETLCCKDMSEKVARACAMDTITIASLAGILLTVATVLF